MRSPTLCQRFGLACRPVLALPGERIANLGGSAYPRQSQAWHILPWPGTSRHGLPGGHFPRGMHSQRHAWRFRSERAKINIYPQRSRGDGNAIIFVGVQNAPPQLASPEANGTPASQAADKITHAGTVQSRRLIHSATSWLAMWSIYRLVTADDW